MQNAIFWPVIAQVALVAAVWIRMCQKRIGEIHDRNIDPQTLLTSRRAAETLEVTAAADNFRNLFEVPVLFFAVCLAIAVTELVTTMQVTLAWVFVGLRVAHSLIHLTYNQVTHRFISYILSALCVLAMWILFAMSLWSGNYPLVFLGHFPNALA